MDKDLYEVLRQFRNEIARKTHVKPYMVLHNKSLQDIAEKKPTSLSELEDIKGMGRNKIAKYGEMIIDIVSENSSLIFQEKVIYERGKKRKEEQEEVLTVSEFLNIVNDLISSRKVVVQGEVGRVDSRGRYCFFSLVDRDDESVINCFVWRDRLDNFGIDLKQGLELKVEGFGKIYKKRGSFTFEVENIGLVGEGALKLAFEVLKKRLSAQGFFDLEKKKEIPVFPQKIGLVTSSFADAKEDFLAHLGNFGYKIYFLDVRVEGFYSIGDVVSAIRWLNESTLDLDVLVLTRGGGSLENLAAFNSFEVAKAIFSSRIPVITGIGHKMDETIADMVADYCASTPTDAARVISDSWRGVSKLIDSIERHISGVFLGKCRYFNSSLLSMREKFVETFEKRIKIKSGEIAYLQSLLILSSQKIFDKVSRVASLFLNNEEKIVRLLRERINKLENIERIYSKESDRWIKAINVKIKEIERTLMLVDPDAKLKQGYSIVFDSKGRVITTVKNHNIGDKLDIKFHQGKVRSSIKQIYD